VASWLDFIRITRLQDLNVLLEKRVEERTEFVFNLEVQ